MIDWEELARRKFLDLTGDAAATAGRYRALVDRCSNLSSSLLKTSEYLKSLEYSLVPVEPVLLTEAKQSIVDLKRAASEASEAKEAIERHSAPSSRLIQEAKIILLNLNVISELEGAAS